MSLLPLTYSFGEELSAKPSVIFHLGAFVVTSSMLVATIAALLVIAVVQMAMRTPKLVPSGLQNVVEWVIETLASQLEGILGATLMRKTFWYMATLFIFIVACNLVALLPGVGTIGYGTGTSLWNFQVTHPFFRGPNADVNLTAAISAVFVVTWVIWSWQMQGPWGILVHIFGPKAHFANRVVNLIFGLLFLFVGFMELISILIRPFTFTFRLYGNIFGGERLLDAVYHMSPNWAILLLTPFYSLEVLIAFVQAFVFFLLAAVFLTLMRPHLEESQGEAGGH